MPLHTSQDLDPSQVMAAHSTRHGRAENSWDKHTLDFNTCSPEQMIGFTKQGTKISYRMLTAYVSEYIDHLLKEKKCGTAGNNDDAAAGALASLYTHTEVQNEGVSRMGEHVNMCDKKLGIPDSPTSTLEFQEPITIEGLTLFLPETVANPAPAPDSLHTKEYSTQAVPMAHIKDAAFYRDVPKEDSSSPSGDAKSGKRGVRELTSFLWPKLPQA
jgi:hypothetical protein